MPFQSFHDLCPEVAEQETRSVTVMPDSEPGLPPGEYGFLEMFCNEPGCDCRRVYFYVISRSSGGQLEAVIAWGWETPEFYAKWLREGDPEMLSDLQGPILNPGSPQSALAPALVELCRDALLGDPIYVERIKRHYTLFREKIDGKPKRKPKARKKKRRN